jgi:hypothetical protein
LRRVGHEAGALLPWLHPELLKLGLPANRATKRLSDPAANSCVL